MLSVSLSLSLFLSLLFSRQGFSVALESVLELALVDQVGFKLTEIRVLGLKGCTTIASFNQHLSS